MLPGRRLLVAAAALAAVLGAAGGALVHLALRSPSRATAPATPALNGQAVWPAGRRPAPAFTLRDQAGHLVSLRGELGRTVLLAFMDPLCRQECPVEGRGLVVAQQQVSSNERATILVVDVNPEATAAEARLAASRWGFSGDWHWLFGTKAQLARVWRAYRITVIPKTHDIVHSTAVYVIDRRGYERVGVLAPFEPQFVADDLRRLA